MFPPEDAVSGSGGRPIASSQLCQTVPGAFSYAHQQCDFESTEVRSVEGGKESSWTSSFMTNKRRIFLLIEYYYYYLYTIRLFYPSLYLHYLNTVVECTIKKSPIIALVAMAVEFF